MFCVYNHRPYQGAALQASAVGLSVLFHLGLVLGLSRYASSLDWQRAVGNRGGWGATEVSLWTRASSSVPRTPPVVSHPASKVEEPVLAAKKAATPSSTAAAETSAAVGVGAGGASTQYKAVLHALLDASKTYPRILRELHLSGVVNVRFRVTRQGFLDELEIIDKQAAGPLQAEAMRFLKRVDRVPIPPADLKDEELKFELPLRYEGRG